MNGPSEETHIVKSISDFSPSKVIVAKFLLDGTADIRYANMAGVFCRSTSEALDLINQQLESNHIPVQDFNASLRTFPDTAYSCDAALHALGNGGAFTKFFINDVEVTPSLTESEWHWFYSEPSCYASRSARSQDKTDKDLCQDGWCSDPTPDPRSPLQESCNDTYTECRNYVDESLFKAKPSTTQYWNLHVPAKTVLFPKHHSTGRIMKEEPMDEAKATAMRKKALANPDVDKFKPYLNPVFDDSASVYFSGQFLTLAGAASSTWELNLDLPAPNEGASSFSHDPPRAYRIKSFNDKAGLQAALLKPFAKNDEERAWVENIDMNCPTWQYKDARIGERAFVIKEVDATLPDVLPSNPTDETWKKIRQEKITAPDGSWSIRTYYEDDRVLNGQKAIVRNTSFPYSDFFWKGCPDLEVAPFKLTKTQLANVLNLRVPQCNIMSLYQAPYVFNTMISLFNKPNEAKERALALKRRDEAGFAFERARDRERPESYECPETALDLLVQRLP